ncbi:MAG: CoA pyrophosphatase [Flavobacteriales bacterium]
MSGTLDHLRKALRAPLPGHDHFLEISGYRRPDLASVMQQDPPPRASAVLALLYHKADVLYTMLMLRPTYDGVHSGQVSFPGGKHEPEDDSLEDTALREFAEETGAVTSGIEVLGTLTPVYIPPSRALVTPFVGYAERIFSVAPDAQEVELLIEAPFELLLSDGILKRREQFIQVMGRTAEIPYFDVQGHVVWGATAMMIAELRALLGR